MIVDEGTPGIAQESQLPGMTIHSLRYALRSAAGADDDCDTIPGRRMVITYGRRSMY